MPAPGQTEYHQLWLHFLLQLQGSRGQACLQGLSGSVQEDCPTRQQGSQRGQVALREHRNQDQEVSVSG